MGTSEVPGDKLTLCGSSNESYTKRGRSPMPSNGILVVGSAAQVFSLKFAWSIAATGSCESREVVFKRFSSLFITKAGNKHYCRQQSV